MRQIDIFNSEYLKKIICTMHEAKRLNDILDSKKNPHIQYIIIQYNNSSIWYNKINL